MKRKDDPLGASAPTWEQLDRYLTATASAEEVEAIHTFFGSSTDGATVRAELLAQTLQRPDEYPQPTTDEEAVLRVRRQLSSPTARSRAEPDAGKWKSFGVRYTGIALTLGGAIAIAVGYRGRTLNERTFPERTYATAIGERATLTLTDGSRVTLAPQTTLHVASGFGNTSRNIALVGEAFFEVESARNVPFIVKTGHVTTRVLGTAFNVSRYPGDQSATVAVTDGRVALSSERANPVVLNAGDVGQATDSLSARVAQDDAARYAAWREGRLIFRDAPVEDVLAVLTRWYGYRFEMADVVIGRKHLTVGISVESAATALASLKQVLDVDLVIDGNTITLRSKRPHVTPEHKSKNWKSTTQPEVGR